ncbi:hypothetical protein [Brevundimonas sp. CEF1]|uniref:hypothetical protein n=1 Tax=Brevundimonas sp. CEF1 TaxID=3442642 RepID=UPI003F517F48
MKIKPPPSVIPAIMLMPDQISFDCGACETTHMLTRGLDFIEDRAGVWRLKEQPGYECDCGAVLVGDFTLKAAEGSPAPSDTPSQSDEALQAATSQARR